MHNRVEQANLAVPVDDALASLLHVGLRPLNFSAELEDRFEADTRKARSHRMWFEGLIAIVGFNLCLILDFFLVRDHAWLVTARRTEVVTPLALAVNFLVRKNPPAWLRESSIAIGMFGICLINLAVEGDAAVTNVCFGEICLLITALFVGVVMRLRFAYVHATLTGMLLAGLWSMGHAQRLQLSEAIMGDSMLLVGVGIILVASRSLEREERKGYLLALQRDQQAAELVQVNAALQELSHADNLTGLPNRRALEQRVAILWERCAAIGEPLAAVVIDVDHFKQVNDQNGHLYGDETLRRLGTLLPQALRSPDDLAARFGGEEFVLLLPLANRSVALTVAERARQLVEAAGTPFNPRMGSGASNPAMWITVSCGVSSCLPSGPLNWTALMAAADEALYAAKRGGRNRVEYRECAGSGKPTIVAGIPRRPIAVSA